MKSLRHWLNCAFFGMGVGICGAHAADIAGDVQTGLNLNEDGGYLEVGFTAGYINNPHETRQEQETNDAVVTVDGSLVYRKKGFFLEAVQGTQDGLNLGYTVFQNEKWSADFLGLSVNRSYDYEADNEIEQGDDEATRNSKLYERDTLYAGTGFRVTRYLQNHVVQFRLVTDIFDNNGVTSSLRFGRGWQIRNWNLYGILGINYTSADTMNYWFGIEEQEATNRYPAYKADAGVSLSAQMGAVKPLTEKWLLRFYLGWIQYSDEAKDSPLVRDSDYTYTAFTINRVFSWGQ